MKLRKLKYRKIFGIKRIRFAERCLFALIAVFVFQCVVYSQENSEVAVSNGVTIFFQNGGEAVTSNGTTISFQNAGEAGSGASRAVSIGFRAPAKAGNLLGNSQNSGTSADPVNTATGNFVFDKTDLTVAGKGSGFEFKRFYNSQDSTSGTLGANWTHSYNLTVAENTTDNTVTVRLEDGHDEQYQNSGGTYTPKDAGVYNKLTKNPNNTFTVTQKDKKKYNFNANGKLAAVVDRNNNTATLDYNGNNQLSRVNIPGGRTVDFTYDASNRITKISDTLTPTPRTVLYGYDANNNLVSVTDARGKITTFAYDANNLLITATDAAGGVVTNTYNQLDRKTAVKDARNLTTNYEYDLEGRVTKITNPLGNITQFEYDAQGSQTKAIDPKGNASVFTFDALNRLVVATDALGNKTYNAYDALGRTIKTTDANGKFTQFFYDALGRLVKVTDADNVDTQYTYDLVGNRLTVENPNNQTATFTYDALNRLKTKTDALNKTVTFTYDEVGNLTGKVDANNSAINYSYDDNNRLFQINYPNSTSVAFEYDANGNRTKMTDSVGVSTYAYDNLNRLTDYADAYGKTIGYEYDANSNRTALIYPDGKRVAYAFDNANRLAQVSDWANRNTNYSYDAASLLSGAANANGTTVNYGYDTSGRLTSMNNKKSDQTVISSYNFTLDAVGNRTNINQTEPLSAGANQPNTNYTYNAANQIQTAGATSFVSDNNGNLKTQTTSGAATNFNYDFENRLTSISDSSTSAQYTYNRVGGRLARTINGATTRYVLDPTSRLPRVLAETDASGNITNYYTHGLGLIAKISPTTNSVSNTQFFNIQSGGSCIPISIANNLTAPANSTITIPVVVQNLTGRGIDSYDFTFSYNSNVIRPLASAPIDSTGTLSSGLTVTANTVVVGKLQIGAYGATALSGSGTLLNLNFEVIGANGANSALTWNQFQFNENDPCATPSNGSVTVSGSGSQITGNIAYGIVGSQGMKFVPNVTLTTSGTSQIISTTNNVGDYLLSGLGNGNYTITPTKAGDVNGINSTDAVRIQQYIVGSVAFTQNQLAAADTSNNGVVNSTDALRIQQYIVQTQSNHIVGQWKFLPASKNYSSLNASLSGENYTAVLMGEVTGNWTPPAAAMGALLSEDEEKTEFIKPGENKQPSQISDKQKEKLLESISSPLAGVMVALPINAAASNGTIVNIPIDVSQLPTLNAGNRVETYNFNLQFDPNILSNPTAVSTGTISAAPGGSLVSNSPQSGVFSVSYTNPNGITGQGTLLNIQFTVIGASNQQTALTFVGTNTSPAPFEFNDGDPSAMTNTGQFTVMSPTAAMINLSGRVSNSFGSGIQNVVITMTDGSGNNRIVRTTAFGYYHFDNLVAGEIYIISAMAKRYTLVQPILVVNAEQDLTEVNFTALP